MILIINFCPKLEKRRYRLSEESVDTCVYPDNAGSKMIQCYFVFHHFFISFIFECKVFMLDTLPVIIITLFVNCFTNNFYLISFYIYFLTNQNIYASK